MSENACANKDEIVALIDQIDDPLLVQEALTSIFSSIQSGLSKSINDVNWDLNGVTFDIRFTGRWNKLSPDICKTIVDKLKFKLALSSLPTR
jgi:hypothetical protein